MRRVYGVAPIAMRVALMLFCNAHSREVVVDQITKLISTRPMTMEPSMLRNLKKVRLAHIMSNQSAEHHHSK